MLLDPFHILSPAPKKKTEDLPDPRIKLADIPINSHLRKIREHMLNMPIDLPDYYDTDLRPENPGFFMNTVSMPLVSFITQSACSPPSGKL